MKILCVPKKKRKRVHEKWHFLKSWCQKNAKYPYSKESFYMKILVATKKGRV